jgi:hypothetical protein
VVIGTHTPRQPDNRCGLCQQARERPDAVTQAEGGSYLGARAGLRSICPAPHIDECEGLIVGVLRHRGRDEATIQSATEGDNSPANKPIPPLGTCLEGLEHPQAVPRGIERGIRTVLQAPVLPVAHLARRDHKMRSRTEPLDILHRRSGTVGVRVTEDYQPPDDVGTVAFACEDEQPRDIRREVYRTAPPEDVARARPERSLMRWGTLRAAYA